MRAYNNIPDDDVAYWTTCDICGAAYCSSDEECDWCAGYTDSYPLCYGCNHRPLNDTDLDLGLCAICAAELNP